jgi:hypothetical protein
MAITQQAGFETASSRPRNYDVPIVIGYAAFAAVLLIAIYLGSLSPGAAPGDFAVMTVFP